MQNLALCRNLWCCQHHSEDAMIHYFLVLALNFLLQSGHRALFRGFFGGRCGKGRCCLTTSYVNLGVFSPEPLRKAWLQWHCDRYFDELPGLLVISVSRPGQQLKSLSAAFT